MVKGISSLACHAEQGCFRNPVVRMATKGDSPCSLRPVRVSQPAYVRARWRNSIHRVLYMEKPPVPLSFQLEGLIRHDPWRQSVGVTLPSDDKASRGLKTWGINKLPTKSEGSGQERT